MFVWHYYSKNKAIWNPVICSMSGINETIEGCLSLPDVIVNMQRSYMSRMIGTGINGEQLSFRGNSVETSIWQHEIDHLYGKLIIDDMIWADTISNRKALRALLADKTP